MNGGFPSCAAQVVIHRQLRAIDALVTLKDTADAARNAGCGTLIVAGRGSQLARKRHALAMRMRDRADDYLRFADDLTLAPARAPVHRA